MDKKELCSDYSTHSAEPLAGSARTAQFFLCVEHLHGWGHDVLDGEALGEELSQALKRKLKTVNGALQLIRKPGRGGQHRQERIVYLVWPEQAVTEKCTITETEELLNLDFSAPNKNPQTEKITDPFILICTHGKRDICCAKKGRRIAAAMQTCFYGDEVWESSHVKGHRYAPAAILMPWGYSYGRLDAGQYIDVVKEARAGKLYLEGNRGRAIWDSAGQAAELAFMQKNPHIEIGAVRVESAGVEESEKEDSTKIIRHIFSPNGQCSVELTSHSFDNVMVSCGTNPKTVHMPVVQKIINQENT